VRGLAGRGRPPALGLDGAIGDLDAVHREARFHVMGFEPASQGLGPYILSDCPQTFCQDRRRAGAPGVGGGWGGGGGGAGGGGSQPLADAPVGPVGRPAEHAVGALVGMPARPRPTT